jgi:exopolysaccharide biosynthesis polyprenyl glycosylphosphotransferase
MAATIAVATGLVGRFGLNQAEVGGIDYRIISALFIPAWLVALTLAGSYDSRFITSGAEQYRRVVNATVWLLAALALLAFAFRADLSRLFVFVSLGYAALLTIVGRFMARRALHRQYAQNRAAHTVLAIGSSAEVADLVAHLHRASYVGFRVVAAITPGEPSHGDLPSSIRWAGADLSVVVDQAAAFGADTLAVAGPHLLPKGALRKLSWQLEGTNIDLLVAPAITDLAGPRIRIRPIDGLPLLQVEKPQFTGVKRLAKEAIDRSAAALLMVLLLPILTATAVAVRLSGPGSILYRQYRVGLHGNTFGLLKFRSMRATAEVERADLEHLNQSSSVLFKMRRDPRVTNVGRFLRRFSLDELPQLWNVVIGDMSLVGPRPPLPAEVDRYGVDVHRRLLVKPGMTGLWQVSGRSDLSWDEAVRLDLHYVDNWSVGLDLVLLWKTVATVIRGRGAY